MKVNSLISIIKFTLKIKFKKKIYIYIFDIYFFFFLLYRNIFEQVKSNLQNGGLEEVENFYNISKERYYTCRLIFGPISRPSI